MTGRSGEPPVELLGELLQSQSVVEPVSVRAFPEKAESGIPIGWRI
jgi:hypothetical protein